MNAASSPDQIADAVGTIVYQDPDQQSHADPRKAEQTEQDFSTPAIERETEVSRSHSPQPPHAEPEHATVEQDEPDDPAEHTQLRKENQAGQMSNRQEAEPESKRVDNASIRAQAPSRARGSVCHRL